MIAEAPIHRAQGPAIHGGPGSPGASQAPQTTRDKSPRLAHDESAPLQPVSLTFLQI